MAQNITKDELQNLRKVNREYAFNLYKSVKKGETFSNVDPTEFFNIMNIDIDHLLNCKNFIGKIAVEENKIVFLAQMLSVIFDSEGNPSTGNESKRSDFILPFVSYLVSSVNRQKYLNVKLQKEYLVENDITTGHVEFVIVQKQTILIIVEAKKENWDLGRAQNMLEIFVAHSNNVLRGFKLENHIVYGLVSTGDDWEIFSYEGDIIGWKFYGKFQVLQLENIENNIVFDINKIKNFFEILNYMLENAIESNKCI